MVNKETAVCPFCNYEACEVEDLGPNYRYQKRQGFECPKCGGVSICGSSEWKRSGVVPFHDPFESLFNPLVNWPVAFTSRGPDPARWVVHDVFDSIQALLTDSGKSTETKELPKAQANETLRAAE